MSNDHPKPKWWRLYAILPLTFVLMALEVTLILPDWGHKFAQMSIVLFAIGLIGLWVLVNAEALEWDDIQKSRTMHLPTGAELSEHIADAIHDLQVEHVESERTRFDVVSPREAEYDKGRNN